MRPQLETPIMVFKMHNGIECPLTYLLGKTRRDFAVDMVIYIIMNFLYFILNPTFYFSIFYQQYIFVKIMAWRRALTFFCNKQIGIYNHILKMQSTDKPFLIKPALYIYWLSKRR